MKRAEVTWEFKSQLIWICQCLICHLLFSQHVISVSPHGDSFRSFNTKYFISIFSSNVITVGGGTSDQLVCGGERQKVSVRMLLGGAANNDGCCSVAAKAARPQQMLRGCGRCCGDTADAAFMLQGCGECCDIAARLLQLRGGFRGVPLAAAELRWLLGSSCGYC